MADLLKRLHKQSIAVNFIEKLLGAFGEEEPVVVPEVADQAVASPHYPPRIHPASQPLVKPLTNRELDVLDLLAQRLSNEEIAEKLFVSTATVKSHLQNIYGKLEVGKRREAVEKAETLGILTQR
jgi:LuxR family maltose regulon positive regulatory protein